MLHVIIGPDYALCQEGARSGAFRGDPGGFDIDRIDAAASSYDAIFAAVTAAPFFGSQRVIVLSGLLAQVAGKGGRGSKDQADGDADRLIAAIPETTTLILFDPDLGELGATVRKQLPKDLDLSVNEAPRETLFCNWYARLAEENDSRQKIERAVIIGSAVPGLLDQAPQNPRIRQTTLHGAASSRKSAKVWRSPRIRSRSLVQVIDELVPQRTERIGSSHCSMRCSKAISAGALTNIEVGIEPGKIRAEY